MSIHDSFERRMGKFRIKTEFIEDYPSATQVVLGNTVIVRAEYLFGEGCIEYTAFCHSFDIVRQDSTLPEYSPVMDVQARQLVRWDKL